MTQLSLDDVVALNALIVTAIGLTLAFGRRDRRPPRLNLTGPPRKTAYDEIPPEQRVNRLKSDLPIERASGGTSPYGALALRRLEQIEHDQQVDPQLRSTQTRQLNVFFNWNGHTWDAYEVLGVPAGAGRESVVQAFHSCRAKSPDSTAFLQAATDAILKRT